MLHLSALAAAAVAHFVSIEVLDFVQALAYLGLVAGAWCGAFVPMVLVEVIVDMAMEALRAMEPGTGADECAFDEPFRAVVAIRGARVRSVVEVAVGAFGGGADFNSNLSCRFQGCGLHSECGKSHRRNERGFDLHFFLQLKSIRAVMNCL